MENILNRTLNETLNETPLMHILNLINAPIIINTNNILNASFEDQGETTNPTNKDFIENLEEIEFEEDSELSCGICLDSFKKGEKAFILPCKDQKHYFHIGEEKEECEGILPWLKTNNTCPICREVFPEEENNDDENVNDENVIPIPEENFDFEYGNYEQDYYNSNEEEDELDDELEDELDDEQDDEDNDEQENNLISEFLNSINEQENNDIPDTETIIQNFLDRIMNEVSQTENVRLIRPSRTITLPLFNFIEAEEDYQLQQAIQRSIIER